MTKYMDGAEIIEEEKKHGRQKLLELFGRRKVAAGMTVADYIQLREFYKRTATPYPNGAGLLSTSSK
jgi:hypothetical protein